MFIHMQPFSVILMKITLQPKGQFLKQQGMLYVVLHVVLTLSSGPPTCIITLFTQ